MRPGAGALAKLFARFDAVLAERGFRDMGRQIVDATVVEPRRRTCVSRQPNGRRSSGSGGQIEMELQRLCRLPEESLAIPYECPSIAAVGSHGMMPCGSLVRSASIQRSDWARRATPRVLRSAV